MNPWCSGSLAFLIGLNLVICTQADDWPFFRGPNYNGVSQERIGDFDGWVVDDAVRWEAEVGVGASSVVVAADRLIAFGSLPKEDLDLVSCFDARSGDLVWQFRYHSPFDARQFEGGTASTPTLHDGKVYTLGYLGHLHCLDLRDGRVLWKKHLIDDFQGRYSNWKYSGSPLVFQDHLILDTGAEDGSTLALHPDTGELLWKSSQDLAGYSTPIPFWHRQSWGVLVFKARAMVALDLISGQEQWRIDWRTFYDCNASCPTVLGDRLFVSTGYGGRNARGALFDLDTREQLWVQQDLETKMNSAVLHQGFAYAISERSGGQLMCCDLKEGAIVWSEASFERYGTLMIAGDDLVILDEKGELVIAQATPEGYRERLRHPILKGRCWAMPVLSNGRIYAKNNQGHLLCLDLPQPRIP